MRKPIIALIYDFDRTLCTKDMQEYGFIPNLGMTPREFWSEVNDMTDKKEMDNILAYMYKMVEKARDKHIAISYDTFKELGGGIEYFEGVDTWFDRINAYALSLGVRVEHYIVSSGIKEIIEGTTIAKYFKRIYACEFLYDYNGTIQWPKFVLNYTTKTQFLFRINKGVLTVDSRSSEKLNKFTPQKERRIPFENMIYIGDGITDVPCMKLVRLNGGQSIAVYDPEKGKNKANDLLEGERVNFIASADYCEGSDIEVIVKAIMDKIYATTQMQSLQ